MDNNLNIEDILTAEEKQQLDIIQKKIQSNLDEIYKKNLQNFTENLDDSVSSGLDEASHPQHISNNQKEMLVYLRAEVSTIDEQGNLKDIQQCLDNYYHIPVAPNSDYEVLLKEFVDKFDSELTSCAKRIHPENVQPE
jgi:hypothetical protein